MSSSNPLILVPACKGMPFPNDAVMDGQAHVVWIGAVPRQLSRGIDMIKKKCSGRCPRQESGWQVNDDLWTDVQTKKEGEAMAMFHRIDKRAFLSKWTSCCGLGNTAFLDDMVCIITGFSCRSGTAHPRRRPQPRSRQVTRRQGNMDKRGKSWQASCRTGLGSTSRVRIENIRIAASRQGQAR